MAMHKTGEDPLLLQSYARERPMSEPALPERRSYFKVLRLAPPQACHELGIPAEAPTFLSPQICDARRCRSCSVTYTPLVYAPGLVTKAQHWHPDRGGIYFHAVDPLSFPDPCAGGCGWIAQVEPLGRTWIDDDTIAPLGRAEAVLVTAITAWCMNEDLDDHEYAGQVHSGHRLEEGILYHYPG